MATLAGVTWIAGSGKLVDAEVSINPVIPTPHGPRDAYRLRIGPNSDGATVDLTMVLQGYQGAHDEFKFLAEVFREAAAVPTLPRLLVGSSRCAARYETGWADIHIIEADTSKEPDRIDVAVYVRDLLQNGPNPVWLEGRCTLFYVMTRVMDAVRFGEALMEQLIAAWECRQTLGISVGCESEDWPAYFAHDAIWSAHFGTHPA